MTRRPSKRKHRSRLPLSNAMAALLLMVSFAVTAVIIAAVLLRQMRARHDPEAWKKTVVWDSLWPVLPALEPAGLRSDEARALYAFAGRNAEVLGYIPCYCGCRSQGHKNNHDCY